MKLSRWSAAAALTIAAVVLIGSFVLRREKTPSTGKAPSDVPAIPRSLPPPADGVTSAGPTRSTSDPSAVAAPPTAPFVLSAWTLTSSTEGTPLDPQSAAFKVAQLQGNPQKGRSASIQAPTVEQLGSLKAGQSIRLPMLGGGSLAGNVNLVQLENDGVVRVAGVLGGDQPGTFNVTHNGKRASGYVLFSTSGLALELEMQRDGKLLLVEKPLSDVVCYPLPRPRNDPRPSQTEEYSTIQATPPILSSRPTATAVIYLDFDGQTVTDAGWAGGATINAAPSALSESQMTEVWNSVKEDFWAFNIDVTTDLARYTAAPANRRTRCIVTPTDTASPGAGGVALLNSFSRAGTSFYTTTVPCWVFNTSVKGVAEAISHEVGHTLGLQHDGRTSPVEDYYEGHGTGAVGWAPIMGSGYEKELVQWSKGEYANANRTENDLAIISNATNGFGYIADEAGGTRASALSLTAPNGIVNHSGIISQASDVDFFAVNVSTGRIVINATPAAIAPNLDLAIELQDSAGTVLATANPDTALNATLSVTVNAGVYYVRVQGTGRGDVLGSGYSSYGSIGAYLLTGSLPGTAQAPLITSVASVNGAVSQALSYQLTADNSPTSFAVGAGTLPAGVTLNTATGLVSGTPTAVGTFVVTFTATNAVGPGSRVVTFTISSSLTLAQALDGANLVWANAGNRPWFAQTTVTQDGVDAAQSGLITGNQTSRLQTTITGPATVSFRWRVDSEQGYDFLHFLIDNVIQTSISGNGASWESQSFNVPAGSHLLEWRYAKDATVSEGQDAGWVDTVALTAQLAPVITSPAAVPGTVGQPFVYQLAATNTPTSYSIVSGTLPSGLTLTAATGVISGVPTTAQISVVTLGATNLGGLGTREVTFSISESNLPLVVALDAPTQTWTTGGNTPWSGQTDITFDNVDAARSGVITHNQTSWMETTVTGPSVVSFRWRIDSEEGYDFLSVRDNGIIVASISGLRDWTLQSINVPAGSHTLRWTYSKDSSKTVGVDAGWVDTVSVSDTLTRVIALSGDLAFGGVPVGASANRTLTITNTGNSVLTLTGLALPNGFTGTTSGTIAPGASKPVVITFTPLVAVSYSGNATVVSDSTEGVSTRPITGTGSLPAPANDSFASATLLSGSAVRAVGNNGSASGQTGEPFHAGFAGGKSIWWRWIAPSTGTVSVNTIGSSFDTLLAVYTGNLITALTTVAEDDETGGNGTSALTFNATAGTTYYIAVDGFLAESGDVVLTLAPVLLIAPNNAFDNAVVLTGTTAQAVASTVTANRESGEPNHGNQPTGKSVWWTWTAPFSGRLLLDTNGSNFDTILAVYTGSSITNLTVVAFDDQSGYLDASALSISVTVGTTYRIAVDGYANASGVAILNLRLVTPPANDNLATPTTLVGAAFQVSGTNVGASKETGEPNFAGVPGGASVWYRWVAPTTGRVSLSTAGSNFDTVLAAYFVNSSNILSFLASNDEASFGVSTSLVQFTANSGTSYYFVVDGYEGATGQIALSLAYIPPPVNDRFVTPTLLSGLNVQVTGTNVGAIKETGESNHAGFTGGSSVWWQWVAPSNARVTISTAGSAIDTLLAVYTGNAVNAVTLIASNDEDDTGTGTSAVSFNAIAGTTYRIAVDGYAAESGSIALRLTAVVLAAPVITTQPSSQTVIAGQPASFNVAATGTAPLFYQWRKDGVDVTGATSATLALTNVQAVAAGSYTVVVTNTVGTATSNAATLTVTPLETAPAITTQPVSMTVTVGQTVTFTVVATGTGPLVYQWRENGVVIGTATTATLTVSNVQTSNNATFTVVVSNSLGSVTSNPATLTVTIGQVAPTIITQPANQVVTVGQTATFSVDASGTGPLNYQWKKGTVDVAGATAATLTIVNAQSAAAGSYSVVVTNPVGSVTSSGATLTVTAAAVAPQITTQPSGQAVTAGQSVTLSVVASGTGPLSYLWKKDTVAIAGATGPTLVINAAQISDAGSYTVTISNAVGSTTSTTAVIAVTPALSSRITNLSVRTTLAANQIVIVGLTLTGGPAPILLRAVGPGLAAFGVSGAMPDPKLSAYEGTTLIDTNDNWGGGSTLATTFASVGAFGLPPASLDAALLRTIDGGRSAHVSGPVGGNVLVEAYQVGQDTTARLTNVSARNHVGTGDDVLIAGFTITGNAPKTVLIRAIGPTLGTFGVPNVLADPKLSIFSGMTKIEENDTWAPNLASTFNAVGAFGLPTGSKDAAIVVTLAPGGYSVLVSGSDGGTGEALVEVYEVNQ